MSELIDKVRKNMESTTNMIVKWSGNEYEIKDLQDDTTVLELKTRIYEETGVRPDRQKLLNLKCKGKAAMDGQTIEQLNIKPGFKLMLMGSREEDIAEANRTPADMSEVVNDLNNTGTQEDEEIEVENAEINLAKIQRRVQVYEIEELNPLRENKKLLVLDVDYTLFDHRSVASSGIELMRPYLHTFLIRAYKNYDIVIWSATSMKWINEKMKLLGVSNHPEYKIAFHLDNLAMISVYTKYGFVAVKPLGVIWGKYPAYSARNTIMFDDIRRNFLMNPKSGLKIRPFRQAHLNRDDDEELMKLADYLDFIADVDDFQTLNHKKWEDYSKKRKSLSKQSDWTHDDNQNL